MRPCVRVLLLVSSHTTAHPRSATKMEPHHHHPALTPSPFHHFKPTPNPSPTLPAPQRILKIHTLPPPTHPTPACACACTPVPTALPVPCGNGAQICLPLGNGADQRSTGSKRNRHVQYCLEEHRHVYFGLEGPFPLPEEAAVHASVGRVYSWAVLDHAREARRL